MDGDREYYPLSVVLYEDEGDKELALSFEETERNLVALKGIDKVLFATVTEPESYAEPGYRVLRAMSEVCGQEEILMFLQWFGSEIIKITERLSDQDKPAE